MRTMTRSNDLKMTLSPFVIASLVFVDYFFLTNAVFSDFVVCDAVYGRGLVTESCLRAYEQMPSRSTPGILYRTNAADPLPPGYDPSLESLILPVVYTDPVGRSLCCKR